MASQQLATTCEPRSKRSESQSRCSLIREWIATLALNAGQALDAEAIGVYTALWSKGFEDLPHAVLEAAFLKTLRECKYWPIKVSDIREHVRRAEGNAASEAAERAWQLVLDLRRLYGEAAQLKALPAPEVSFDDLHARGLKYAEQFREAAPLLAFNRDAAACISIWNSEEERQRSILSLREKETNPALLERYRRQKAALAERLAAGFDLPRTHIDTAADNPPMEGSA